MLIGNQIGQVRSTCHCLRKSNNSSVFSGKNAGKFHMFDLLNLTLSFSKRNGYFIYRKQTKISNIKNRKSMSQSFCNLRDAIEDCPNLNTAFSYCRPNCVI